MFSRCFDLWEEHCYSHYIPRHDVARRLVYSVSWPDVETDSG